ncbi:translation initiation factor IF-2 [Streptomyces phaeofaciens]|uniref:translation initiation factor IF-2 n=1 Tax=Streptomyces phaeofaciens TaxID=68254 RepID=UPI00167BC39E|nr:translation initiation factor IF-2 [Streptomyces phaeofaciens]
METDTKLASNGVSENEPPSEPAAAGLLTSGPSRPGPVASGPADPWGEQAGSGGVARDHDPDEVTVQIDAPHAAGARSGQEASDVPVFVDESGRRSRTFRRIGISVGIACGAYAVVIVATLLSGNAGAPWLPVPGQGGDDKPSGEVDATRGPRASATPSAGLPGFAAPGTPGVSTSASGALPASSGASAGTGAATGGATAPAGSADPRTTPSGSPRPSAAPSGSASTDPGPSSPVVGGTPTPPASTPPPASPSADSSPSPAGGAGTTVAAGPPAPVPVASQDTGAGEPLPAARPAA